MDIRGMVMNWFGFWLFMAVLVACDCWVFTQGYDSLFQRHKTDAEKEIQRIKIEAMKRRCGLEEGAHGPR